MSKILQVYFSRTVLSCVSCLNFWLRVLKEKSETAFIQVKIYENFVLVTSGRILTQFEKNAFEI